MAPMAVCLAYLDLLDRQRPSSLQDSSHSSAAKMALSTLCLLLRAGAMGFSGKSEAIDEGLDAG